MCEERRDERPVHPQGQGVIGGGPISERERHTVKAKALTNGRGRITGALYIRLSTRLSTKQPTLSENSPSS